MRGKLVEDPAVFFGTTNKSRAHLCRLARTSLEIGQTLLLARKLYTPPSILPCLATRHFSGEGGGWVFWCTVQISDPKSIPKMDQIRDPEKTLLNQKR